MKNSYILDSQMMQNDSQRKPQSSYDDRKSRQNSKQGHVNPLKMKTSFLRQSLSLTTNQVPLTLNDHNSVNYQRRDSHGHNGFMMQPDRKQEIMMRKIAEKFSNNTSPTNAQYPQPQLYYFQNSKDRQIIKLSGRKNENLGFSIVHRSAPNQKQNTGQQQMSMSVMNSSNTHSKIQPDSFSGLKQKGARISNGSSITQSVIFDSSLADYAQSNSMSHPHNDQSISVIQNQLQVILKRLAKNQCDLQTLRRDNQVQVQLQGVWKQISINEKKLQVNQRRLAKNDERLTKNDERLAKSDAKFISINEAIQELNNQFFQLDSQQKTTQSQIKNFQGKFLSQRQEDNLNKQNKSMTIFQSQLNEVETNLQKQMENLHKDLNYLLDKKINFKINDLAGKLKGEKLLSNEDLKSSKSLNDKKFVSSQKKSHQFISVVYKQILKVSKKPLKESARGSQSGQCLNVQSDRSKLLANVLNNSSNPRKFNFSMPVSPQNSNQIFNLSSSSLSSTKMLQRSNFSNNLNISQQKSPKQLPSTSLFKSGQIEINQVDYFIDEEGYLLDEHQFYIVDENNQQIKISQDLIELLKQHNLLKN